MEVNEDEDAPRATGLTYFSLGIQILMALVMSLATLFPYRKGFFPMFLSRWFYYPFLSVFAISVFIVYLVQEAFVRLDQKYRWEKRFLIRLLYQLLYGWIVPVAFSVLYTWAYLQILDVNIMTTLYSRYKFPSMAALVLILNAIYLCRYFDWYFDRERKQASKIIINQQFADYLTFARNGGEIKISVVDIAYLCSHGKHTAIQFHEEDPLILAHVSLDDILPQLDPDQFCKVNRSYIITRKAYEGYTARKNRGVLLQLKPKVNEEVKVSRTNTEKVLSWLKNRSK
jgi:hypothetical protein